MTELETAIQTFLNAGVNPKALYRTIQGDQRNALWRVRIKLLDHDEVIADSDPHLPAASPGGDVVSGLQAVAGWTAGVIAALTGEHSAGIAVALEAKLPSLRVNIARHKGDKQVYWRFVYPSLRGGDLSFVVSIARERPAMQGAARRVA